MENSVKVPLSRRMLLFCGLFTLFGFVLFYGTIFMLTQPIYMEDDILMPFFLKLIVTIFELVIELGIIFMVFPFWKRIIKKTGAMTITSRGIENTFALFNLFAFWTIFKINYIPWNAMILDENDETICIDFNLLPKKACGRIARILLLGGFNYSIGKISFKELKDYRDSALETYHI